jgi:predicted RNase H-like HicB family nuclease
MTYYIGILDGAREAWGVRVPDFPGVHGGGATPDAAIADAISALRELAGVYVGEGKQLPGARTIVDVLSSSDKPDLGEAMVMLPLLRRDGLSSAAQ